VRRVRSGRTVRCCLFPRARYLSRRKGPKLSQAAHQHGSAAVSRRTHEQRAPARTDRQRQAPWHPLRKHNGTGVINGCWHCSERRSRLPLLFLPPLCSVDAVMQPPPVQPPNADAPLVPPLLLQLLEQAPKVSLLHPHQTSLSCLRAGTGACIELMTIAHLSRTAAFSLMCLVCPPIASASAPWAARTSGCYARRLCPCVPRPAWTTKRKSSTMHARSFDTALVSKAGAQQSHVTC
jgi:hypothetical protein